MCYPGQVPAKVKKMDRMVDISNIGAHDGGDISIITEEDLMTEKM